MRKREARRARRREVTQMPLGAFVIYLFGRYCPVGCPGHILRVSSEAHHVARGFAHRPAQSNIARASRSSRAQREHDNTPA
eukprot:6241158-Alexandrium_andersonii.AAC.1